VNADLSESQRVAHLVGKLERWIENDPRFQR
jgi:hypothetical protein